MSLHQTLPGTEHTSAFSVSLPHPISLLTYYEGAGRSLAGWQPLGTPSKFTVPRSIPTGGSVMWMTTTI